MQAWRPLSERAGIAVQTVAMFVAGAVAVTH
jgi:hypothetical protein